MKIFDLSRNFWNWAFDNPEKITPSHAAIYFFAIEHCNRLGGKKKFGFPSQMTMDAIGIKKHQTYIKYFNDLCELGFFKLIQKSQNQYSSNIISLVYALPKKGQPMDKANINHMANQIETNRQSTGQSKDSIDRSIKQTKKQSENQEINPLSHFGTKNYEILLELDYEWEARIVKKYNLTQMFLTEMKSFCDYLFDLGEVSKTVKDFKSHYVNLKNKRPDFLSNGTGNNVSDEEILKMIKE